MNTSSEETEALSVIVLEYGTVKSLAIRLRGVQFKKCHKTNLAILEICSIIVTSTLMTSSEHMSMYQNQLILNINNWKYTPN